jgi:L-ascorbate metabolism protein UlaG (beta-lactamase superfamily)
MEIRWLGEGQFRLRAGGVTVLVDPADGATVEADVVALSDRADPARAFPGEPFVIHGPGEYEVKGVFVVGVDTATEDAAGPPNTAYCLTFVAEDVSVCHLGRLGHLPSQAQVEALGDVDVLLLPVGGGELLGAAAAAEAVNLIDPALVVPMWFRSDERPDLEPLDKFLREMGMPDAEPEDALRVDAGRLPEEPEVVVLRRWPPSA